MASKSVKAIISAKDNASRVFRSVGASLKALGVLAALVGAVMIGRKLVGGIGKAIEASGRYEAANIRLAVALKNAGQNTKRTREDFRDYAKELARVSLATETQVLSAIAQAKSIGASNEVAKLAIQAATEYASILSGDLPTAIRQVNRTLAGYAGELQEVVPQVKGLSSEELRAGGAAKLLAKIFKGAGAEGAKAYEGAMNNLRTGVEQLRVSIGVSFRQAVTDTLNRAVLPFLFKARDWVDQNQGLKDSILGAAAAALDLAGAIADVSAHFNLIDRANFLVRMGMIALQQSFVLNMLAFEQIGAASSEMGDNFRQAATDMRALIGTSEDLGSGMGEGTEDFLNDVQKMRVALKNVGIDFEKTRHEAELVNTAFHSLIENVWDSDVTDSEMIHALEKLREMGARLREEGGPINFLFDMQQMFRVSLPEAIDYFVENGLTSFQMKFTHITEQVEKLGMTIRRSLRDIGVNAAMQFGDTLVEAAFGADVSFKEFFVNLIKQLIKAIVLALILRAILAAISWGGSEAVQGASGGFDLSGAFQDTNGFGFDFGLGSGAMADAAASAIQQAVKSAVVVPPLAEGFSVSPLASATVDGIESGGLNSFPEITIHVETDLPATARIISDNVRSGHINLVATSTKGARQTR